MSSTSAIEADSTDDNHKSNRVMERLCTIRDTLAALPDLVPHPEVNQTFSELVQIALSRDKKVCNDVLCHEEWPSLIPDLHQLCGRGEWELELHWAKRICAAEDPLKELSLFPYLQNYKQLIKMESSFGMPSRDLERHYLSTILRGKPGQKKC